MTVIKIGCDPEVFVRNPNSKQFVSAHNLIPGTKKEPYPVNYGAVQVDGMALEFNIDPATTEDEFVRNVTNVYHELGRMVPGYELVPVPTAQFTKRIFDESPPEALELGCEPDFNAYTGRANIRPNAENVAFRTASGHVHIGWTENADIADPAHLADCHTVVKALDVTLGGPSTLYDKDQKRRQLYGAAGAFRPKSYGVEYRVLSNVWLTREDLMRWVFTQTKSTIEALFDGKKINSDAYGRYCLLYPRDYKPMSDRALSAIHPNLKRPPSLEKAA